MGLKTQIRRMLGHQSTGSPQPSVVSAQTLAAQFPDVPERWRDAYLPVRPFTMTSPERVFALCQATEYAAAQNLPGDFVECGVWRGGSSMAMLNTLLRINAAPRNVWLYDTFEGMSQPTSDDVDCFGHTADALLAESAHDRTSAQSVWCEASLEDVRQNVEGTNYPKDKIHYVVGKVEETIPSSVPDQIALLRLDTDWFDSTWHELQHLYPRLVSGGILIIDDYGHWQGCRQAVDKYLAEFAPNLFLNRIDYTGRLAVKP